MKKTLAILNLVVILVTIFANYYVNTIEINGNTVGSLSDTYFNYFTPAGYAFSIWGIIFIGLLAHGIFQVVSAFSDREDDFIVQIGPWLMIANVGNAAWLFLWLNEMTGLSVLVMLLILVSLTWTALRLKMELIQVPRNIKTLVWGPIGIYLGWIAVATVANISAYLGKIGWSAIFPEITWAIIMIIVAAILNILMVLRRRMLTFGLVGVWSIVAIAVRHWNDIASLQWTAVACVVAIIASMFIPQKS